ncbi:hypothetical protein N7340_05165 [Comamonas aquatica]|uniref:hypothetical protein n=1 Tax=Comamonas aquatica TaxID=225991 RepID=UPI00244840AA|nr:hypothetical protein [Comamonas aquatica]MDH0371174.1 hypothetical protein [Comamonas aquatica]
MLRYVVSCSGTLLLWMGLEGARAAPAPWYWWTSKVDGQRVCAQFMPRQGWTQAEGPFTNPQCRPQRQIPPR